MGKLHDVIRSYWLGLLDENGLAVRRPIHITDAQFFGKNTDDFTPLHYAINYALKVRLINKDKQLLAQDDCDIIIKDHLLRMLRALLTNPQNRNHHKGIVLMLTTPEPVTGNYPLSMCLQEQVLAISPEISLRIMEALESYLDAIPTDTLSAMLLHRNSQNFTPYMLAGKANDSRVFATLDRIIVSGISLEKLTQQAQAGALTHRNNDGYNCFHAILQAGSVASLDKFIATLDFLRGWSRPTVIKANHIRELVLQETSTGFSTLLSGLQHPSVGMTKTYLDHLQRWLRIGVLDNNTYKNVLLCYQSRTKMYCGLVYAGQAQQSENFWYYTQALKKAFEARVLSADDITLMLASQTCGQNIVKGFTDENFTRNTKILVKLILDVFNRTPEGNPATELQSDVADKLRHFTVDLFNSGQYLRLVQDVLSARHVNVPPEEREALQPPSECKDWRAQPHAFSK